jgi:hypothetical protein
VLLAVNLAMVEIVVVDELAIELPLLWNSAAAGSPSPSPIAL